MAICAEDKAKISNKVPLALTLLECGFYSAVNYMGLFLD